MNFKNHAEKTTQAVARLIEKSGAPVDYLRLAKLIYLAERESILSRGVPIVGGQYYSMRNGPAISEMMDFVHRRNAPQWKETISPRYGNEVRLEAGNHSFSALSQSEMEILDSVVAAHVHRTTEELVDWCHLNCPEYEQVSGNARKPIPAESILVKANKSEKSIGGLLKYAKEIEELDSLLA